MNRRTLLLGAGMTAFLVGPDRSSGAEPRLSAKLEDGVLRVTDQGRPVLQYRHGPVEGPPGTGPLFTRSGYLHPVHAPCGAIVTDDFPPDHLHQRGVFFAWTKTRIGTADG